MSPELRLDDGLGNYPFAMDDVLQKKGLDSLCNIPVDPKQARSPDLEAIEDDGSYYLIQEVPLG